MTLTLATPLIAMWVLLNNVVTELTLRASVWLTVSLPMMIPVQPAIVPMRACAPINDMFTKTALGRLGPQIGGGIFGLIVEWVVAVIAVIALIALVMSFSKKAPEWIKALPRPLLVIFGALAVIALVKILFPIVNNWC